MASPERFALAALTHGVSLGRSLSLPLPLFAFGEPHGLLVHCISYFLALFDALVRCTGIWYAAVLRWGRFR